MPGGQVWVTYILHNILTTSIAQLIADDTSIPIVPSVVTHCAPVAMETHLHSTLVLVISVCQTNFSICTVGISICGMKRRRSFVYMKKHVYSILAKRRKEPRPPPPKLIEKYKNSEHA